MDVQKGEFNCTLKYFYYSKQLKDYFLILY